MTDVMIIDDDIMIRDYLKDIIKWEELGLCLCCEAGDSETAWELFETCRPMIVVTDISIPVISGLELSKKFLKIDPDVKIIVITGLGEVENVRESVEIGAVSFLTKPIIPEEINDSLKNALRKLSELRNRYRTGEALESLIRENRQLLADQYLLRLLEGKSRKEETEVRNQLQLLEVPICGKYYLTAVLDLESDSAGGIGGAAFPVAFREMCNKEFLAEGLTSYLLFQKPDVLICLLGWDGSREEGKQKAENVFIRLLHQVRICFGVGFRAGIGQVTEKLSEAYTSLAAARMAAQYGEDAGLGIMHFQGSLNDAADHSVKGSVVKKIAESIRLYKVADFQKYLVEYFDLEEKDMDEKKSLAFTLLAKLTDVCNENGIQAWKSMNYPEATKKIMDARNTGEVRLAINDIGLQLMNLMYEKRNEGNNYLIQRAKEYIQKNLSDLNLSLDTVSEHVGMSRVYLSQLFHKVEGINFNTYINMERTKKAKEQLVKTDRKVNEISQECGFSNVKYFNYVFKKMTGVTPVEYRNKEQRR